MNVAVLSITIFVSSALWFTIINFIAKRNCNRIGAPTKPTIAPRPAISLPKPITREIDGKQYIFHDGCWFLQFPFDDDITLELCVGVGAEWIKPLLPIEYGVENALSAISIMLKSTKPLDERIHYDNLYDAEYALKRAGFPRENNARADYLKKREELLMERADEEKKTGREAVIRIKEIDREIERLNYLEITCPQILCGTNR